MKTPTQYPEYASPSIAAKVYGVTTPTLRRWAKTGKIGFILTPGGQYRYDIRSHLALMSASSAAMAKPEPQRAPEQKAVKVEKPMTPKAVKAAAVAAVAMPAEPEMTSAEIEALLAPKARPALPEGVELRSIGDDGPDVEMREWNPDPVPAPAPKPAPKPAPAARSRKAEAKPQAKRTPPQKPMSQAELAAKLEGLQQRSVVPA